MDHTVELLAPAGDWEAMRAAVANGANAVYFGLDLFNARARAHNFTLAELPEVMEFLHAHNVRGFVTFNILIFSDELPEAERYIRAIAEAGVDAVIVQDLGLMTLINKIAPTLPIHASTQTTLTEPRGIEFMKRLGVQRVVLARELSIVEIAKITQATDMPVEVFVHGALCVAYSGQCLTSEALGGRSANRGQCAQACRLPYEMVVDGQAKDLGDKAYLLSPQDLAAYDHMKELIDAGVISFKIEGRLKGGPYVASTTHTYRNAIDAALAGREFDITRREELDLAQTFSRGFTPGFFEGNNHQRLVRGRFPKSRGIAIGKVVTIRKSGVRIKLLENVDKLLQPGDGLMFDIGHPEDKEPGGRAWQVFIEQGYAEIQFKDDSIDWSLVDIGCTVWKTDDPELRKRLESSYSKIDVVHRQPVTARLSGELGGLLLLTLSSQQLSASATWPGPLETARNRPTSHDDIREQLARMGETPFVLEACAIQLPENVLVPKSVLNQLRREACDSLLSQRREKARHVLASGGCQPPVSSEPDRNRGLTPPARQNLVVLVRNHEQLRAVLDWQSDLRPAMVYCDFEDLRRYKEAVEMARSANMPVGVAGLRVWKPGEDGFFSMVTRSQPDAVLVRNLASIEYFRETLPGVPMIGDFSLNISNELTAKLFVEQGLQRITPSYDLNWNQFESLCQRSTPDLFEAVIHQHMPMFHMEHCVFAAFLSTGKDFRDCGRPCDTHKVELRDRVGANFPVLPDTGCRNTVFNSVAQSGAEYIGRMKQLGVQWFRIELLREKPDDIAPLLDRYARVIAGQDDGRDTWRKVKALNQLGVTRGTLKMA